VAASDARIRALVARLKAEGYESAHLDRLKASLSLEEQVETLEAEVRSEIAFALGRTGRKLEAAMLELELATEALERAGPEEIEAAEAAFEAARLRALDARRDLSIHREAIGIRQPGEVARWYPIPGPRRTKK